MTKLPILSSFLLTAAAFAGESTKTPVAPEPQDDHWHLSLAMPGWLAGVDGESGIDGHIANVDLNPGTLIRRVDMTASLRAEASKGRFGLMTDFLYLSLSDGIGTNTVVKKIDAQLDQVIGELAARWRVVETSRASLDVYVGARYMYLYQAVALQPNDERIDNVVDTIADRAGSAARARAASTLRELAGENPGVPNAPLAAPQRGKVAAAIGKVKGNRAERREKIKQQLHDALDTRVSRADDWVDPFIGLRARYNLNDYFYISARGDIGGFGVGSDFAWTAEGSIGCHLTRSIFAEFGYRALGVDYDKDGLIYDTITHGAQITVGMVF